MLIQDIVRRIRETTGDTAVVQFSNETLTDWINDAIREIVTNNSLLQAKATAVQVAGQKSYTLPEDIFKIHSMYSDTEKLEILSLGEFEDRDFDLTETGNPTVACIYAGKVDLFPTPSKAGSIYVNYSKMPKEVVYISEGVSSATAWVPSTPDIPVAYHNRIVTYCLAQVALQDSDYALYQALKSEFETGVFSLDHVKNQTEQHYPYITTVDWEMY